MFHNIVRIFAQSKSKFAWVPIPIERADDVNKLYPYLELLWAYQSSQEHPELNSAGGSVNHVFYNLNLRESFWKC